MRFKVGDVVVGNESASEVYSYTGTGWIGVVIDVNSDSWDDICVRK